MAQSEQGQGPGQGTLLRDWDKWHLTAEDIIAQSPPISLTELRRLLDQIPRSSDEDSSVLPDNFLGSNPTTFGLSPGSRFAPPPAAAVAPPPPPPPPPPPQMEKGEEAQKPKGIPGLTMEDLGFLELCRLHSASLTLNEGDTLVIIDYPDHPKFGPDYVDCYGTPYHSQEFRVHSDKLRATGSSKFAEMLSPAHQFRIRRRRKLAKKILPEGVDYVLDLTPPSEGDDLAFQMTRLSLTPGIIDWCVNGSLKEADAWMVNGHDDFCRCKRQTPIAEAIQKSKEEALQKKEMEEALANGRKEALEQANSEINAETAPGAADAEAKLSTVSQQVIKDSEEASKDTIVEESPPDSDSRDAKKEAQATACRSMPDYCPIRHRNSIVRLLMLIQGWDIMLDSANRVWSLVAVASIWDCTSVVRDQVAQWIMYDQNIKFIEALPEEALRISFDLQLVQVAQCAFRILANELAIEQAAMTAASDSPLLQQKPARTTVFGRRKGNLDDELSNIVQHAARALVERMSSLLTKFQNPAAMPDLWKGYTWTSLGKMEKVLAQEEIPDCISALSCLRRFMEVITRPMDNPFINAINQIPAAGTAISERLCASAEQDLAKYVPHENFQGLLQIIKTLSPVQKFLCPFFYQEFHVAWSKFWTEPRHPFRNPNPHPHTILAAEFQRQVQQLVIKYPHKALSADWDVFFYSRLGLGSLGQRTAFDVKRPLISMHALDMEFSRALRPITDCHIRLETEPMSGIARHLLLALNDDEMEFLPLWAGGLDDGTGAVFEGPRPPAHLGPDGPGPAYHTGMTLPSAPSTSTPASLFDGMSELRVTGSTVVGSMDAQDSISTVYGPRHVIPHSTSMASGSYPASESEFLDAALELPHQAENAFADWEADLTMGEYLDDKSVTTITDLGSVVNDDMSDMEDAGMDASIVLVNEQSDSEDSVVLV